MLDVILLFSGLLNFAIYSFRGKEREMTEYAGMVDEEERKMIEEGRKEGRKEGI